jgi:hypothetical protein
MLALAQQPMMALPPAPWGAVDPTGLMSVMPLSGGDNPSPELDDDTFGQGALDDDSEDDLDGGSGAGGKRVRA